MNRRVNLRCSEPARWLRWFLAAIDPVPPASPRLAEAFLHEPTVEGECIICDIDEVDVGHGVDVGQGRRIV